MRQYDKRARVHRFSRLVSVEILEGCNGELSCDGMAYRGHTLSECYTFCNDRQGDMSAMVLLETNLQGQMTDLRLVLKKQVRYGGSPRKYPAL